MNFLFILTVLLPVWAASSKQVIVLFYIFVFFLFHSSFQLFTTIEKLYNNGGMWKYFLLKLNNFDYCCNYRTNNRRNPCKTKTISLASGCSFQNITKWESFLWRFNHIGSVDFNCWALFSRVSFKWNCNLLIAYVRIFGALSFTITLGITDLKSGGALNVSTNEHITHEGYNSYLNNDIALIKLGSPIEFNGMFTLKYRMHLIMLHFYR